MARKLNRYVVGYDTDSNSIRGARWSANDLAFPGTLAQARRRLRKLPWDDTPKAIYKLVPVAPSGIAEPAKKERRK